MEEDHYRGFLIPQQAMVIANLWYVQNLLVTPMRRRTLALSRHIARDSDTYAEPDAFRPERYLDMDPATLERADPRKIIFGFGRRYAYSI